MKKDKSLKNKSAKAAYELLNNASSFVIAVCIAAGAVACAPNSQSDSDSGIGREYTNLYSTVVKSDKYTRRSTSIAKAAAEYLNADTAIICLYHPYEQRRMLVAYAGTVSDTEKIVTTEDDGFRVIKETMFNRQPYISKVTDLPDGALRDRLISTDGYYMAYEPFYDEYGYVVGYIGIRWNKGKAIPSDSEIRSVLSTYAAEITEYTAEAGRNTGLS